MRVGTLCYATCQGLGYLAKNFVDNGVVTDPFVVLHRHHPNQLDWYPDAPQALINKLSMPEVKAQLKDFISKMDVMLFFETPFDWSLIPLCREMGVKTVVEVMHECMPESIPFQPDLWLCPSMLDFECFSGVDRDFLKHALKFNPYDPPTGATRCAYLPVPVDWVKWRQRTKAEVFVHNAGHGGLKGRNGTKELLEAIPLVKSPAKFIIRTQESLRGLNPALTDSRVHFVGRTVPWNELYEEGDVFCFPEHFNGLSLPLQEARAAGMLVMATDRFPNNDWLPFFPQDGPSSSPLIPVSGTRKNRIGPPYREFDEALIDPKDIAERIDAWYGQDIADYSLSGKQWAEENGWTILKPKYLKVLEDLCLKA